MSMSAPGPILPAISTLLDHLAEVAKARAELLPREEGALAVMKLAMERLADLGWRDALYAPKDGTPFDAIEAGSIGIHTCVYLGKWPDGAFFYEEAGDLWPARPAMFRLKESGEGK